MPNKSLRWDPQTKQHHAVDCDCGNCEVAALTSKSESLDSTEQYYAHMESDRNAAEASYFAARPLLDREGAPVETFRAGFERAYQLLWNDLQASRRETGRACQETREALAREVAAVRGSVETSGKPAADPACPDCRRPLHAVRNSAGSMLNDDQFDAVRAGDWYCESCPSNARGNTRYRYFWNRELHGSPAETTCSELNTHRASGRERNDQPHTGAQVIRDTASGSVRIPEADPAATAADTRRASGSEARYSESATPGGGCSPAGAGGGRYCLLCQREMYEFWQWPFAHCGRSDCDAVRESLAVKASAPHSFDANGSDV